MSVGMMERQDTHPYLEDMMFVKVSEDPSFSNVSYGLAVNVQGRGKVTDVVVIDGGGIRLMRECWHVSDPRVQTKPQIIRDDPDRGVYDLADAEKEKRLTHKRFMEMLERMAGLDATCAQLGRQMATLRENFERLKQSTQTSGGQTSGENQNYGNRKRR